MTSILNRIRNVSLNDEDDEEEEDTKVDKIETVDDFPKVGKLTQRNDGQYDYLVVEYEGVPKEKLRDYLENNRFFLASLVTARAEELSSPHDPKIIFPLFKHGDYYKQNIAAYVFYEIRNLSKKYEDGRILLIKKDTKTDITSPTKSPLFRSSEDKTKKYSPPPETVKGRGRGSRR